MGGEVSGWCSWKVWAFQMWIIFIHFVSKMGDQATNGSDCACSPQTFDLLKGSSFSESFFFFNRFSRVFDKIGIFVGLFGCSILGTLDFEVK